MIPSASTDDDYTTTSIGIALHVHAYFTATSHISGNICAFVGVFILGQGIKASAGLPRGVVKAGTIWGPAPGRAAVTAKECTGRSATEPSWMRGAH